MGHPKVLEACVIGVPHPKWSERPMACVVPKPDYAGQITNRQKFLIPATPGRQMVAPRRGRLCRCYSQNECRQIR